MTKKKKASGGFQGKGESKRAEAKKMAKKKNSTNQILIIGVIVIVIGLVGSGMAGIFGGNRSGVAQAVQFDTTGAEVVSIEEGSSGESQAVAVTDRETRYLGPDSNSAALTLAESGQAPIDAPTLVWFHADW
ncbi:MAG: hypothetical protein AAF629_04560 [Chloroflexota bacterium]